MDANMDVLEGILPEIHKTLRGGLLTADVLDMDSGLSLFSYESNPIASALMPRLTVDLKETLVTAGLPPLEHWYMLNLAGGVVTTVIHDGPIMCGFAVDTKQASIGVLVSVCIPKVLKSLAEARRRA